MTEQVNVQMKLDEIVVKAVKDASNGNLPAGIKQALKLLLAIDAIYAKGGSVTINHPDGRVDQLEYSRPGAQVN